MCRWINFGDVNFLQYGGNMVRKEKDGTFSVFMLEELPEDETKVVAALKSVDIEDIAKEDRDTIVSLSGYCPQNDAEYASCFGIEPTIDRSFNGKMYPCTDDYIISREEAAEWMKELGAA